MSLSNQEIKKLADQHLMHNVSRYNIALVKGKGLKVWDADGKEYYDFIAGIATCALGHSSEILAKAISEQANTLVHISNLFYNQPLMEVAKVLTEVSGLGKAYLCNSGTEANEAAIKLARKYSMDKYGSGRYGIITAQGSFHGRTFGSMSATGQEKIQSGFQPLVPGFTHVPYGDIEALTKAITPETCAIMLEPIMGEGGIVVPPAGYFQEVENLCQKLDLLLILDEIQTGLGRTGYSFAFQYHGVKPHIITLAKALGCGVPVGAMLAQDEIAKAFTPGSHSTTVGGAPLAMAASLAMLNTILKPDFLENVIETGFYFKQKLMYLKESLGEKHIQDVRGLGLMLALELSYDSAPIAKNMLEKGFIINSTAGTVLRFVPPLTVTKDEIDLLIQALSESLSLS